MPIACTGGTSPSFFASIFFATRGSRLNAATIFSPSLSLNSFWTGSPYPVEAGTSTMRAVYATPRFVKRAIEARVLPGSTASKIGRASCRERGESVEADGPRVDRGGEGGAEEKDQDRGAQD